MISTEDRPLFDRFDHNDEVLRDRPHEGETIGEELFVGKAKEVHPERSNEKRGAHSSHHHHHTFHAPDGRDFIVDVEDGGSIETLSAAVEISLTDDEHGHRHRCKAFPHGKANEAEDVKTEVIRKRHEKKRERRERKERKRQQLLLQQKTSPPPSSFSSSPSAALAPTSSASRSPSSSPAMGRPIMAAPPQCRFPMLLVLDLDGTLVHSEFQRRTYQQHDFSLFNNEIFVFKRPYLDYFVSTILGWFDVAVWTASGCEYAAEIVRHIFPDPSKIAFLFSSERCTNKYSPATGERIVIKDMKKVKRKGYDLKKVLIVDDTPSTWQRNYGNAIHIESYWGSHIDDHLLHLLTYLEYIGNEEDVRMVDKRRWRNQVLSSSIHLPLAEQGSSSGDESKW